MIATVHKWWSQTQILCVVSTNIPYWPKSSFPSSEFQLKTGCLSSHTLSKNLSLKITFIPHHPVHLISHLIHIHVEDWKRNSKLTATFEWLLCVRDCMSDCPGLYINSHNSPQWCSLLSTFYKGKPGLYIDVNHLSSNCTAINSRNSGQPNTDSLLPPHPCPNCF